MPLVPVPEQIDPLNKKFIRQSKISIFLQFLIPNFTLFCFTNPLISQNFFFCEKINNATDLLRFETSNFQEFTRKMKANRRIKFFLMNLFLIYYVTKNYSLVTNYEYKLLNKDPKNLLNA